MATSLEPCVYVVLGVDEHEHDQVIAVRKTFEEAKCYCNKNLVAEDFYDTWIEKHYLF